MMIMLRHGEFLSSVHTLSHRDYLRPIDGWLTSILGRMRRRRKHVSQHTILVGKTPLARVSGGRVIGTF